MSPALHFRLMGTQRSESTWWCHPSQAFTDTEKIDLFNDPPWETVPSPSPRRAAPAASVETARRKVVVVRRMLMKRGQHGHSVA